MTWINRVHFGDCLETLRLMPDGIAQTCVTSPPYFGLRDYGHAGQIGLEPTPDEYVAKLVAVFREVRRVLRDDGTLWLNLGDSYCSQGGVHQGRDDNQSGVGAGSRAWREGSARADGEVRHDGALRRNRNGTAVYGLKSKDLIGIPWMVAFALRADGWYLRQDIIWAKPNPMPESVTDRCTKSHEYIFLLSKSARYYYDHGAIKEPAIYFDDARKDRAESDHKSAPTDERNGIRAVYKDARSFDGKHSDKQRGHGRRHAGFNDRWDQMTRDEQCSAMRNKRSVWAVATKPYSGAHFATFPPELIEPCILAGAPAGGVVLDPFFGSGTSGEVAQRLGRAYIGCELNPEYEPLQRERLRQPSLELLEA